MKKITQNLIFSLLAILVSLPMHSHESIVVATENGFLLSPSIISFFPTSGIKGTTVTITGSNFSNTLTENIVTFNGIAATVTNATSEIITILVPETATSGAIKIMIGSEEVTSSSIFTVLSTSTCNGVSNNNTKYWYFGYKAGLKFESSGPVALTDGAMNQTEGVATMSDANGNLLFYTNGITIYNRNHETMENGSGLTSHSSNTQAAFVVPFPGNPDQYFVITPDPYYYSIVDMTLDNGNGAVIEASKNTLLTNEASEKVAGLMAANQKDIWLITYGSSKKNFNVYKITPSGIDLTPVTSTFEIASGYYGYMKISPDGTKIALANFDQSFHLYDFDAVTGIVSNQKVINYPASVGGYGSYGLEFSPNSNFVYTADHRGQNRVYQFDITLGTPELIANSKFDLPANAQALGALQLGPDNKIYLAKENSIFLGVINNPNAIGEDTNFVSDAISLEGKSSALGLPGFVASSLIKNEPYITSFSPSSGKSGDSVTINGMNFSTSIANNLVKLNGILATVTAATNTSLTITVPNNATTGSFSIEIGCSLVGSTANITIESLGVDDIANTEKAFKIFPNPSKGFFNIQTNATIENVSITISDLNGRIVQQSKAENLQNKSIDLHHLQNGIYVLNIKNATYNYSQKLVKQ